MTAQEAAAHLRLSKSRFYQLIREGKIAPYKLGGQGDSKFSKEELDALMTPVPADGAGNTVPEE